MRRNLSRLSSREAAAHQRQRSYQPNIRQTYRNQSLRLVQRLGAGVNQISILICIIGALIIAIVFLCKQESYRPLYLKIEVQYGR
ncbi:MAG: hypothetical protein V7K90_04745 [Nostoc sp.]|uniref:hypothetical protein n=1 Tax=Nostoc sp. TaxID=1180 RepID=UPI002FF8BE5B